MCAVRQVRAVWLTLKALGYDTLGYKPGARLVNRIASLRATRPCNQYSSLKTRRRLTLACELLR